MYLDHVDKLMKEHSCYLLTSVALLFIYHSYSAGIVHPATRMKSLLSDKTTMVVF